MPSMTAEPKFLGARYSRVDGSVADPGLLTQDEPFTTAPGKAPHAAPAQLPPWTTAPVQKLSAAALASTL